MTNMVIKMENSIVELLEKTNSILNGINIGICFLFIMVAVMIAILIIKK